MIVHRASRAQQGNTWLSLIPPVKIVVLSLSKVQNAENRAKFASLGHSVRRWTKRIVRSVLVANFKKHQAKQLATRAYLATGVQVDKRFAKNAQRGSTPLAPSRAQNRYVLSVPLASTLLLAQVHARFALPARLHLLNLLTARRAHPVRAAL